jgi:hypothetical protein
VVPQPGYRCPLVDDEGGAISATAIGDPYPATFTFDRPERIANWRPLVHWLLAIPHLAIVYVLGAVSEVVSIISWFTVLFTGRLPARPGRPAMIPPPSPPSSARS